MNKRERIMIIGGVAFVGLLVLYFAYTYVSGKFDIRNQEITKLEKQLSDQKKLIDRAGGKSKFLREYEARALPPQAGHASSLYRQFLVDIANRQAGLRDVNIRSTAGGAKKGVYTRLAFAIAADGSLEQLTKFLYLFYSVDYLHRVQSLRVQPIDKSKDLRLTIFVEALSLPGAAKREQLESGPAKRLALATLDEYLDTIVERNLFAPPNQPPKVATIGTQQATTKKLFSLTIKADEFDWLDILKIEVEGAKGEKGIALKPGPLGKIGDPQTTQFSWTPPAKGEYVFHVRAIDDGVPSRFDETTFKIVVKDPVPPRVVEKPKDPPKPKFDVAKYTYLTSILEANGEPGIWFIERTTGKRIELGEGDKFEIGSMKGKVVKIGLQDVEIDVGGKRLVVPLGSPLSEAVSMGL